MKFQKLREPSHLGCEEPFFVMDQETLSAVRQSLSLFLSCSLLLLRTALQCLSIIPLPQVASALPTCSTAMGLYAASRLMETSRKLISALALSALPLSRLRYGGSPLGE